MFINYRPWVLFIFSLQIFVFSQKSDAKIDNPALKSAPAITLTAQEIKSMSKKKQIEYFTNLREALIAAESAQRAFYGNDFYAKNSNLLLHLLLNKVWAKESAPNSCIIAGNVGILNGGLCSFTDESKLRNQACGPDKVACNPALYGDNACIDFANRSQRNNATAQCNQVDFSNVLKMYNNSDASINDSLKKIIDATNAVNTQCTKPRDKPMTPDQKATCATLQKRVDLVSTSVCNEVNAQANSNPILNDARKKSCQELDTIKCENASKGFDADFNNLGKACAESGYPKPDGSQPYPINQACYREIDSCKKDGHDSTVKYGSISNNVESYEKCNSGKGSLTPDEIKQKAQPLNKRVAELKNTIAATLKQCVDKTRKYLLQNDEQVNYGKFLKLLTYDGENRALINDFEIAETRIVGDDASYNTPSDTQKNYNNNRKTKAKRKIWRDYVNDTNSENEKRLSAVEKDLNSCDILEKDKLNALSQIAELKALNNQTADLYRHNADFIKNTGKLGLIDATDLRDKNRKTIEEWFNDKNNAIPSYNTCCLGNNGQPDAHLRDKKTGTPNSWCSKQPDGVSSLVYKTPPPDKAYENNPEKSGGHNNRRSDAEQ